MDLLRFPLWPRLCLILVNTPCAHVHFKGFKLFSFCSCWVILFMHAHTQTHTHTSVIPVIQFFISY